MKKNGFTLIELLAVIVVLAIIALIATPIVLNIINNAKTSSNERSGELYIKTVENAIMKKQMNGTDVVDLNTTYVVDTNGNICKSTYYENASDSEKTIFVCPTNDTIEISVDGDIPNVGSTITLGSNGVVTEYNMIVSGTSIVKENSISDNNENSNTYSCYIIPFQSGDNNIYLLENNYAYVYFEEYWYYDYVEYNEYNSGYANSVNKFKNYITNFDDTKELSIFSYFGEFSIYKYDNVMYIKYTESTEFNLLEDVATRGTINKEYVDSAELIKI